MPHLLEALQSLTDPFVARLLAEFRVYANGVCERTAGHVVPSDDVDHAVENCPCRPAVKLLLEEDGTPGHVIQHYPFTADDDETSYP